MAKGLLGCNGTAAPMMRRLNSGKLQEKPLLEQLTGPALFTGVILALALAVRSPLMHMVNHDETQPMAEDTEIESYNPLDEGPLGVPADLSNMVEAYPWEEDPIAISGD